LHAERLRCARCSCPLKVHEFKSGQDQCLACLETAEFEKIEQLLIACIAAGDRDSANGYALSFKAHCLGIWPALYDPNNVIEWVFKLR